MLRQPLSASQNLLFYEGCAKELLKNEKYVSKLLDAVIYQAPETRDPAVTAVINIHARLVDLKIIEKTVAKFKEAKRENNVDLQISTSTTICNMGKAVYIGYLANLKPCSVAHLINNIVRSAESRAANIAELQRLGMFDLVAEELDNADPRIRGNCSIILGSLESDDISVSASGLPVALYLSLLFLSAQLHSKVQRCYFQGPGSTSPAE
jgi:hypothetical protein